MGEWGTIFPLLTYSLRKFVLTPILHSYLIQDGSLIQKCALASQNMRRLVRVAEKTRQLINKNN